VAFVDVLPAPVRPENLPKDTIWRDPPHETIPGAFWLPNTGYAGLDDETRDYFLAGVAAATGGETDAPVVFFCRSECWMSWNAAKRALEHGYTRVFWFPDGTDGWTAAGSDLQVVKPYLP
jgi:PQQ-dependent catabolism-associated CXXCW motif protein